MTIAATSVPLYPGIDREIRSGPDDRALRRKYILSATIEAERLTDLATGKGSAILQSAVVATDNIICVAITRPPTNQS